MNRRQFFVPTAAGAIASVYAASLLDFEVAGPAFAQDGKEPLGGQPPPGSTCSIKDFDYQVKYQRASRRTGRRRKSGQGAGTYRRPHAAINSRSHDACTRHPCRGR
jgi:hypothetical protein